MQTCVLKFHLPRVIIKMPETKAKEMVLYLHQKKSHILIIHLRKQFVNIFCAFEITHPVRIGVN